MDLSLLPSLAQHYSSIFSSANSSSSASSSSGYYHHHHHHHQQQQQQQQHQTLPTSSTSTYPSVVVGHPGLNDSGYYHHNHGTSMSAINPQTTPFYPYHHISNNGKTSSYYDEIVGGGSYIINGEINNFVRDSNSETSETSNFDQSNPPLPPPPPPPPLPQHPLPSSSSSSYCYLEKQPFSTADGSPNAQTKWSAFDESAQNLKQQPHPLLLLTNDTHKNPLMDDYYQHSSENKEEQEQEQEEEEEEDLDGSSSYEKNSLKAATIPNPNHKSTAGINGGRIITQEDENYITITTTTANGVVRVVKRRSANKKERRRTQSINSAFSNLRDCIPNVPADTKLSKIKTLRLATSYISYLMKLLDEPGENGHKLLTEGFRADLSNAKRSTQQNRIETQNEIQRQLRLQQYKQLQQQQQQSLIVPRRHNSHHHHHHHHHHNHNHDNHQHKFSEKSNKSTKTNHADKSGTIGRLTNTEQQPFDLSLEKTNNQCLAIQNQAHASSMMITGTDALKHDNCNLGISAETSTPPSSPSTMVAIHPELPSAPNLRPRCRTGWPQHVWALELKNYDQ